MDKCDQNNTEQTNENGEALFVLTNLRQSTEQPEIASINTYASTASSSFSTSRLEVSSTVSAETKSRISLNSFKEWKSKTSLFSLKALKRETSISISIPGEDDVEEHVPTPKTSLATTKDNQATGSCKLELEDRSSIASILCRICYDDERKEKVISPCLCKGTAGYVHKSCLEQWLGESNSNACELCHLPYHTERSPRFSALVSIFKWLQNPTRNMGGYEIRGLRGDLIACSTLTPLAFVITYICLYSADYYSQKKFNAVPAARWTSLSLLVMVLIMIFGYYLWMYMVIKYHGRIWYYWWQRDSVVVLVDQNNPNENAPVHSA